MDRSREADEAIFEGLRQEFGGGDWFSGCGAGSNHAPLFPLAGPQGVGGDGNWRPTAAAVSGRGSDVIPDVVKGLNGTAAKLGKVLQLYNSGRITSEEKYKIKEAILQDVHSVGIF
mmetsp:Transcript_37522/g.61734  ORF Transcript_37522/g.61734 Transcript_37522/m.61734 type:complete len:116 (+) Transcript_37522:2-349(+)